MSGYLLAIGPCWACRRPFAFDPDLVPSYWHDGERRPLCRDCVGRANELRQRAGMPLIVPLAGAYPEAD